MSADIEKMAVFDDRIVQSRPRYAVEKGALSVTNSPFNAIAANTSQHTYNVLVPSENIFIDRAVDWTSTAFFQTQVYFGGQSTGALGAVRVPLVNPGANAALAPFPLQSLTTTMTATINDTTVTINSADVLPQVLRMTDMRRNRMVRTCPTMLDRYQTALAGVGAANSPLSGYDTAISSDQVANGSFSGLVFTTSTGQPLAQAAQQAGGVYIEPTLGWVATVTAPYPQIPASTDGSGWSTTRTSVPIYFSVTSTEKLVLSPFVFSDVHEWDTGLFGCQNIQLVMNLGAVQAGRVLRYAPLLLPSGTTGLANDLTLSINSTQFNVAGGVSGFQNSRVNIQFLTPSLDVPLPPKSVVPYMEYPRYISSQLAPLAPQTSAPYSSQTITLPQIPDLLMIYVKPAAGYSYASTGTEFVAPFAGLVGSPDANQSDFMLPITNISVNFDNFAGLLSAHTQQQLYKMSVHNGLDQDWLAWSGTAWVPFLSSTAAPAAAAVQATASLAPLVGGMLVLKPGRDIVLQAGQAPSLVGNFVLQFNLTVFNNSPTDTITPQIYVITANSGFFETIKGSSRVIKGVLTEQDIISAPVAPGGTSGALRRAVGAGIHGSMGNALHHLKSMFSGSGESMKKATDMSDRPKAMSGRGKPQQVASALASRLM